MQHRILKSKTAEVIICTTDEPVEYRSNNNIINVAPGVVVASSDPHYKVGYYADLWNLNSFEEYNANPR